MFQSWRFQLREAQDAADRGQFDEACQLLVSGQLRQYLPGKRLAARVASQLAQRARRRMIQGDLSAAWRDLQAAKRLSGEIEAVLAAQQEIVALALGEAEHHIESGAPNRAIELLESLQRYQVQDEPLRWLKQIARHLESARNLALRGKFADAQSHAVAAQKIHPQCQIAKQMAAEYGAKVEPFRKQLEGLHRAVTAGQWSEVVGLAEKTLEMAPHCKLAQDVRRRAWVKIGAQPSGSRNPAQVRPAHVGAAANGALANGTGTMLVEQDSQQRFLLWIDGVGGYLVCLADEVILGQATPTSSIDIPIQADLSRQHTRIRRHGDGYVIEPLQVTSVNGQRIRGRTLLSDGDEIEMNRGVRLRFRQPHALSASARLDFLSHHRPLPKADGVLLMAESCVLGPRWQNHVVCRDWQEDVVLYRRDGELFCRAMDSIEIDGHLCDGHGPLAANSHVCGSDFSFSLEEIS